MATSFISISSEAGRPDNPIKRLVWLRAVWANTGLFQLCLSLCLCGNINESLSVCHGLQPKPFGVKSPMQSLSEKK